MRVSHQAHQKQNNAFTRYLKAHDVLQLPIAHGEGRFVIPDNLLQEIQFNGQNVFQYCDAQHVQTESLSYHPQQTDYLSYYPQQTEILSYPYIKTNDSFEVLVDSILIDNHSMSIEAALKKQNIYVQIHRYIHWNVECDSHETLEKIKKSGVIFNDQKERTLTSEAIKKNNAAYFLTEPKI